MSNDYYSQVRSEMLKYIPLNSKKILDVGCGDGSFGNELKQTLEAKVYGIELNDEMALVAKERLDQVFSGDITQTLEKLPDSHFDCIVFNDVLEHLADPNSLLLEIKSKLSNSGVIVCSIPNVRYLKNLINLIFRKQWKYEDYGVLDRTHLRFFTRNSIIDMFDELDYELISIEGINPLGKFKFGLINCLTLGFFSDTKYLQYACVVKVRR